MDNKPIISPKNLGRKPPGYTTSIFILSIKAFNLFSNPYTSFLVGALSVALAYIWFLWYKDIKQFNEKEINIFNDKNNNIQREEIPEIPE